jgi:excisionase family DNA binding protein
MPDFLSRNDAATYLRCSLRKIDRLKASGRLPYLKLDGNTLFRRDHLLAMPVALEATTTNDAAELPSQLTRPPARRAA